MSGAAPRRAAPRPDEAGRRVALTIALPPGMVAARIAAARPDLSRRIDGIMFLALQRTIDRIRAQWPIRRGPTGGRSQIAWGVIRLAEHRFQIRNDAREDGQFYAGFVFRGDPKNGADDVPGVRNVVIADDATNSGGLLFEVRRAYEEINRAVVALVQANPDAIRVPERRLPDEIRTEVEPIEGRRSAIVSNELEETLIDVAQEFDFTTPERLEPRRLSFFELVLERLKRRLRRRAVNAIKSALSFRLGRVLREQRR